MIGWLPGLTQISHVFSPGIWQALEHDKIRLGSGVERLTSACTSRSVLHVLYIYDLEKGRASGETWKY